MNKCSINVGLNSSESADTYFVEEKGESRFEGSECSASGRFIDPLFGEFVLSRKKILSQEQRSDFKPETI